MARFTDTLATLFGAGVPLIACLEMVGGTMGNTVVAATIDRVIDSIKSGAALSAAMAETQFFTPMVIQMTAVGEESGSLETMLGKVATFYQTEVDAATDNLTNCPQPDPHDRRGRHDRLGPHLPVPADLHDGGRHLLMSRGQGSVNELRRRAGTSVLAQGLTSRDRNT